MANKPEVTTEVRAVTVADMVKNFGIKPETFGLATLRVLGCDGSVTHKYVKDNGTAVTVTVTGTRMVVFGSPAVLVENVGSVTVPFAVHHANGRYPVTPTVAVFDGCTGDGVALVCRRDMNGLEPESSEYVPYVGMCQSYTGCITDESAMHAGELYTELSRRRALLRKAPVKGVKEARRKLKARNPKHGSEEAKKISTMRELGKLMRMCKFDHFYTRHEDKCRREYNEFLDELSLLMGCADVFNVWTRGRTLKVCFGVYAEDGVHTVADVSYKFAVPRAAQSAETVIRESKWFASLWA